MFRVQWEWGNSGYALALRPKDKFTRWNEHKGKYDSVWLIQNGWRFTGKKSGDDCLAMAPENSSETN